MKRIVDLNSRNDWREKMKEERQTNMETFGQTGIRRGRGRGRGSRGRGGSVRGKGTGNAPVGAVSSSGQEVA